MCTHSSKTFVNMHPQYVYIYLSLNLYTSALKVLIFSSRMLVDHLVCLIECMQPRLEIANLSCWNNLLVQGASQQWAVKMAMILFSWFLDCSVLITLQMIGFLRVILDSPPLLFYIHQEFQVKLVIVLSCHCIVLLCHSGHKFLNITQHSIFHVRCLQNFRYK